MLSSHQAPVSLLYWLIHTHTLTQAPHRPASSYPHPYSHTHTHTHAGSIWLMNPLLATEAYKTKFCVWQQNSLTLFCANQMTNIVYTSGTLSWSGIGWYTSGMNINTSGMTCSVDKISHRLHNLHPFTSWYKWHLLRMWQVTCSEEVTPHNDTMELTEDLTHAECVTQAQCVTIDTIPAWHEWHKRCTLRLISVTCTHDI